jgi:hypothetical protein
VPSRWSRKEQVVEYLSGLNEYLDAHYKESVFDAAAREGLLWEMHTHSQGIIRARITQVLVYDLKLDTGSGKDEVLPKIQIKCLYPESIADSIKPLLAVDRKVRDLELAPHLSPRYRHHVKNKTLFPLMKEKSVLIFTLLGGEIIKGIVAGFTRYDITTHMKRGIPITLLRHAIYDIRDKRGRCYLKSSQETLQDWKKSSLYIQEEAESTS